MLGWIFESKSLDYKPSERYSTIIYHIYRILIRDTILSTKEARLEMVYMQQFTLLLR